jgi:hypothetical protein
MISSPPSRDSRIEPCSQFDEKASRTFSIRGKSDRRGILRPEADVDALNEMRARRKFIEVNGVEILPEDMRVCKDVDTSSESSSSPMMTSLLLVVW